MRSLYWLVGMPLKAGSHAYALEQSNIASTSQAVVPDWAGQSAAFSKLLSLVMLF